MQAFTTHQGQAAVLPLDNVDTDMIIPKDFMKTVKRSGLGEHVFEELRRYPDGKERSEFVLNQPDFRKASILISGENFGCGSSREHAPWALIDYGFKVIIAGSFADIFATNSLKNGLLLIALDAEERQKLTKKAYSKISFEINLERQQISSGELICSFAIEPNDKKNLLEGLDEISLTLRSVAEITSFEERQKKRSPWLNLR